MPTLHALHDHGGQSPWLDNLRRAALASGELEELVNAGIRGVTSNPTIFQRSVLGGSDYDEELRMLVDAGRSAEEAYWDMAVADVDAALDLLAPLHGRSGGADGFVSIEVPGAVAHDAPATVASARGLHDRIGRPNLLVKVPASDEGIVAIRELIAEGRSINVTLIFGIDRYAEVIEAYLSGLEACPEDDLSGIHSVASFFLSRVDTVVDAGLAEIGTADALALRGRAALAQAELAYDLFRQTFSSARWRRLAARGARPQRPLWASTSTKNPGYPDLLYVTGLVAPDTVNTMTEATIEAFRDHGTVEPTLGQRVDGARQTLDALTSLGVDMAAVSRTLEDQGVALFVQAFDDVVHAIDEKAGRMRSAARGGPFSDGGGAMGTRTTTFVIIGAGLAGAKAAEALRGAGFDGRIMLIGEEPERPYDRPPLSKGFLRDLDAPPPYLHDGPFYAAGAIELLTGTRVTGLDPHTSSVMLAGGTRLRYDRLLLATGSVTRTLDVPGADLEGVRYLRTLADARRLRADTATAERVVVVGGGWVATEVAAAVRQQGRDVTLVHRGALPLEKVLGPEVASVYRDVHVEKGVRLVSGELTEVLGRQSVEAVRLGGGDTVDADLVIVGIGARPRTELAETAGLAVDDGVLVDEYLRTSAPGVFAAGDVARAWHPLFGTTLRVEHWANALNQGSVAAANMLGGAVPYARIPYAYSDQYDLGMEYSGHAPRWDRVVFRGDPRDRRFIAFWLDGFRVVAGMNVNEWDVVAGIQQLVRSGRTVDPSRLADRSVPLDAVAAADVDLAERAA